MISPKREGRGRRPRTDTAAATMRRIPTSRGKALERTVAIPSKFGWVTLLIGHGHFLLPEARVKKLKIRNNVEVSVNNQRESEEFPIKNLEKPLLIW
jgi:hypothetical protein